LEAIKNLDIEEIMKVRMLEDLHKKFLQEGYTELNRLDSRIDSMHEAGLRLIDSNKDQL
jgi:hypothetical protein